MLRELRVLAGVLASYVASSREPSVYDLQFPFSLKADIHWGCFALCGQCYPASGERHV